MSTNPHFLYFKLKAIIWASKLTRAEAKAEARITANLYAVTRDEPGRGLLLARGYALRRRLTDSKN